METLQQLMQTKKEKFHNLVGHPFDEEEEEQIRQFLEDFALETAKLVVEDLVPEEMERDNRGTLESEGFNNCRNQIISNARAMGIGE